MSTLYFKVLPVEGHWEVRYPGQRDWHRCYYDRQATAISAAMQLAEFAHRVHGRPTIVRVLGTEGRWYEERRYGVDPAPTLG
jgi:hypothetical protein